MTISLPLDVLSSDAFTTKSTNTVHSEWKAKIASSDAPYGHMM